MKKSPLVLTCLCVLAFSEPAWPAATPDGAQKLIVNLQAYFSDTPGVVTVTPDGDSYIVKIDIAPVVAKAPMAGVSTEMTPFELKLTDQGGGKWLVERDNAVSLSFKVKDILDVSIKAGRIKGFGVFDENLGMFDSSILDVENVSVEETISSSPGMNGRVSYQVGKLHYELKSVAAAGGADATIHAEMTDLSEAVDLPVAPGSNAPPARFKISIARGSQDTKITGLRARKVLDLAARFIAHPTPDAMTKEQAALKDKLRGALPLFANIEAKSIMENLTAAMTVGEFGAKTVAVDITANGLVEAGMLRERFSLSGITVPQALIPPWASDLVPGEVTLDFNVAGFNLAAPAAILLDDLDLTATPPIKKELEPQLLAALLPKGKVTIGLGPSEIIAKLLDLKAEGSMTAGPGSIPAGQATVRAKGIDAAMEALKAAPPEMGMQQMIGALIAAKELSKQESDGGLSWKIESTPAGGVLINGVDPTKM